MIDGYEVVEVRCELHCCGGDVEPTFTQRVSDKALLELLAAIFPRIEEDIDAIGEIRLTVRVREL